MEKNKKIKIKSKDGIEKEYAILSTFDYKSRKFIIYADYSMDEANNMKVYSGIYDNEEKIQPITSSKDELVVSNFVKFLEKGLKDNTLFEEKTRFNRM